jgi:hypothetical protein
VPLLRPRRRGVGYCPEAPGARQGTGRFFRLRAPPRTATLTHQQAAHTKAEPISAGFRARISAKSTLVEYEGMIWSVDNRRVLTFRSAGMDIPYEKTTYQALTWYQQGHFTSVTNGESIIILVPR